MSGGNRSADWATTDRLLQAADLDVPPEALAYAERRGVLHQVLRGVQGLVLR